MLESIWFMMRIIIEVPRVDLHVHLPPEPPAAVAAEILAKLADLRAEIQKQGMEIKMAISVAEQALLDRFDAATSAIAAEIQGLINNPPADNLEFNSRLQTIADGLEQLGKTVPPAPPTV